MTIAAADPKIGMLRAGAVTGQLSGFLDRLDAWRDDLRRSREVWNTIDELNAELTLWRRCVSPDAWREIVERCRRHPIAELIHQDLFTAWSFRKIFTPTSTPVSP